MNQHELGSESVWARPSPPLFDPIYYVLENPEVERYGLDPWVHYLERGAYELRNPNPLFDSGWYLATQLRGQSSQNPLIHYLREGACKGLDPHPLIDSRCYILANGEDPEGKTPLERFLLSEIDYCAGAYRSIDTLQAVQSRFFDRVELSVLEDARQEGSRWAVFLQCGVKSLHPAWIKNEQKPWDLLVNFYDDSHEHGIKADVRMRQNLGTKFSAVYRLLKSYPNFLERYDYVFFLDDDIRVCEGEITRLFELVETLSLQLAQPAVAWGSHGTWEILFEQAGSIGRFVNAVEIMMPVLSRRALHLGRYLFGRTVSGWGLDFALGQEVERVFGPKTIGVIDAIAFAHECPIDTQEGNYYRMLRENGLSPLVEERVIDLLYGARGPIRTSSAGSELAEKAW